MTVHKKVLKALKIGSSHIIKEIKLKARYDGTSL
jgi:hypothetical protein